MELVSTVTDVFEESKVSQWQGRELTTEVVVLAASEVEKKVLRGVLDKPRSLDNVLREFMITHCQGTTTTRVEFTEAVRHYLDGRWS